MTLARLILFNKAALVLLFAALAVASLIGLLRPSWAMDPLAEAAADVLHAMGVGGIPLVLWALWVLNQFAKSFIGVFRRWRYVIGSGILVASCFAILTYFKTDFPLIGLSSLGGEVGEQIRGETGFIGFLRTAALSILGAWLVLPSIFNRLAKRSGRLAARTASASARRYRADPLHRGVGKLIWRTVRRGAHSIAHGRLSRSKDDSIGKDLDAFLLSNPLLGSGHNDSEGQINSPNSLSNNGAARYTSSANDPIGNDSPLAQQHDTHEAGLGVPSEADQQSPSQARRGPTRATATLPPLSLLDEPAAATTVDDEHQATAALIEETLADHGVEVSVAEIRPGPSVTMFGLVPGWNRKARSARARALAEDQEPHAQLEARNRVKVDSILAREKDLALALAAPSLRIEAPVPGESVVGVEVPNKSSSMVSIRSVMESDEYTEVLQANGLSVALGLASAGEPVAIDLLKMPHLLIAGATGSGKSVCINTIISSIITHQPPSKVRLLLVDPKRVELTPYNGIPHLVTPVVVEPHQVIRLLRGAIQEMLRRYKLLEEAGVRNIQSYNASPRAREALPYFVICIDELADLMMTASFEVEQAICRLAQLGRATGIHLIVATQRPSVDVVTGLIKANFPSRIAFAVASQVDSRTILDSVGAERLLGRGDMLFLSSDSPKARRVQGVFISESETEALGEHWRHQPVDSNLPEIALEVLAREADTIQAENSIEAGPSGSDSLYEQALHVASANRQLSTSLLQRRLRIGYPRAARLMDQLEEEGVVAPTSEPGKPREVLYIPDV